MNFCRTCTIALQKMKQITGLKNFYWNDNKICNVVISYEIENNTRKSANTKRTE